MYRLGFFLVSFLSIAGQDMRSTSHAQDLPVLAGMATRSGSCEKLIMAGRSFSEHCKGKIVQSIYTTGRTGFTVVIGDEGAVATFSAMEGERPDADSQLQSLDKAIFNLGIEGSIPVCKNFPAIVPTVILTRDQ
ncbi:hypothetical protein [Pararhizobium sp. DWP1-1-3]|uniref:hypothetical protein n=1 Tax=Pararhizobium sp. DWP1-1-3 TaxID=2804652 RepID=UPI003CF1BAFD